MEQKKAKSSANFLVQGSILAIASIVSRLIGLIYRIPMTRIIGDVGNNYYGTAFEVYNVLLIISSYSLPLAVSKLVSAQHGKNRRSQIYQILKGAFVFAACSGLIVALILFFGAQGFANALKTRDAVFALRILAPTLLIVAILGVLRGFFQGLGSMIPTAISQIIEQIVNAFVSVYAAYVLFQYGKKVGAILGDPDNYAAAYGAAGGTLGTSIGALFGLLFMFFIFFVYMTAFKKKMKRERNVEVDSFGYTMKMLVITIVPVLLSTTVYNISGIVDQFIFKNIATAQGYDATQIKVWWGVYTGKYKLMINIPISIASAMAASAVPTLTASFKQNEMEAVRSKLKSSTRLVMIIAFPCAVGLGVLAKPIFTMLFGSTNADMASVMMYLGAIAIIFYSLSTLSNGLLQGIDKLRIPVVNAAIALVVHALLLVAMMLLFRMNIYAVIMANTFFAIIMCLLNQFALAKHSGYRHDMVSTFLIPLLASVIMGIITFAVYFLLNKLTGSIVIPAIIAIIIAIVVYALALILMKGISESDILSFPGGRTIVKFLKKVHLLK